MAARQTQNTPTAIDPRQERPIAHAVAQQELEGLKVSPATLEDMHRAARGEISTQDVIANIYARFGRVPPEEE
jgi:hypothetical protein